jgi:hypothetical protein
MANPTDQPASPAAAVATIGGVLTDLAEVAAQLPVPAPEIEHVARILDRLSEEIAEAAAMLRSAATPGRR